VKVGSHKSPGSLPFVLCYHKKAFQEHATPHFSTSFQVYFNKVKIAGIEGDLILQTTLFIFDFYKVTIWKVGIHFERFEDVFS